MPSVVRPAKSGRASSAAARTGRSRRTAKPAHAATLRYAEAGSKLSGVSGPERRPAEEDSGGEASGRKRFHREDASWATRRPGDPATRRPGDPATRRPGDPATRRPGDPATRRPGDPATRRPLYCRNPQRRLSTLRPNKLRSPCRSGPAPTRPLRAMRPVSCPSWSSCRLRTCRPADRPAPRPTPHTLPPSIACPTCANRKPNPAATQEGTPAVPRASVTDRERHRGARDRPRRSRPIAHPRPARTAMVPRPSTPTVPHPSRIPPRTNRSMTEPVRLFSDRTIQNRTRRAGDARPLPFLGRFGGIGLSPYPEPSSPSDDARDRRAFEAERFPPDSRRSCLPDRRSPEIPPSGAVPPSQGTEIAAARSNSGPEGPGPPDSRPPSHFDDYVLMTERAAAPPRERISRPLNRRAGNRSTPESHSLRCRARPAGACRLIVAYLCNTSYVRGGKW